MEQDYVNAINHLLDGTIKDIFKSENILYDDLSNVCKFIEQPDKIIHCTQEISNMFHIIENIKQSIPSIFYLYGNNHATTILIIKQYEYYYIMSFNSGLGINEHDTYSHHDDITYYKPYYYCKSTDLSDVYIILQYIRLISIIYTRNAYSASTELESVTDYINGIYENENISDNTKKIIEIFTNTIIIEYQGIIYTHENYHELIDLTNEGIYEILYSGYIKYSFYEVLINIFKLINNLNIYPISDDKILDNIFSTITSIPDTNTILPITEEFTSELSSDDISGGTIPENIIIKNMFRCFNVKIGGKIRPIIYITEQKSGSCQWYSMFWAHSFAILFMYGLTGYKEFLININTKTITQLNKFFSEFINNYNIGHTLENKYNIVHNLYNKALNLKLLFKNPVNLKKYTDVLYDIDLKDKITTIPQQNDNHKKMIKDFFIRNKEKYIIGPGINPAILFKNFASYNFCNIIIFMIEWYFSSKETIDVKLSICDYNTVIQNIILEAKDADTHEKFIVYLLYILNEMIKDLQKYNNNKDLLKDEMPINIFLYYKYISDFYELYELNESTKITVIFYTYITVIVYIIVNNIDNLSDTNNKSAILQLVKTIFTDIYDINDIDAIKNKSSLKTTLFLEHFIYYNNFYINDTHIHNLCIMYDSLTNLENLYFNNIKYNFTRNNYLFTPRCFETIICSMKLLKNDKNLIDDIIKNIFDNRDEINNWIYIIAMLSFIDDNTDNMLYEYYYSRNYVDMNTSIILQLVKDGMSSTDFLIELKKMPLSFGSKTTRQLLARHNFNDYYDAINTVKISDLYYSFITIDNNAIKLFFNTENNYTLILYSKQTIFILSIHDKIELTLKNDKIVNIKYNDNEVVTKYDNLPFYHFLPKSIFHLIYIENGLYKVAFFNNFSLNMNNNPLINIPEDHKKDKVETITINPDNLCFLIPSDYNVFIELCKKYGINKHNSIFFNDVDIKCSYLLTDYEFNYIKFNKKSIFTKLINYSSEVDDEKIKEFILLNNKNYYNIDRKKYAVDDDILDDINKLIFDANKRLIKYDTNTQLYLKLEDTDIFNIIINHCYMIYNHILYLKIKNFLCEIVNTINTTNIISNIHTRINVLYTNIINSLNNELNRVSKDDSFDKSIADFIIILKKAKKNPCKILDYDIEKGTPDRLKLIFSEIIKIFYFLNKDTIIKFFNNYIKRIKSSIPIIEKSEKIFNVSEKLKDRNNLENIIKIYNELFLVKSYYFKYVFEVFFEFLSGIEILEFQYNKYLEIIKLHKDLSEQKLTEKIWFDSRSNVDIQLGGIKTFKLLDTDLNGNNVYYVNGSPEKRFIKKYGDNIDDIKELRLRYKYKLHHFMMGKGKSTIITPLASLYYHFICNKNVVIIVPSHLVDSTKKLFNTIHLLYDFNTEIYSDLEIKTKVLLHLSSEFQSSSSIFKKDESIMLIDEFDTIIDPNKSNLNIKLNNNSNITNIKLIQILSYQNLFPKAPRIPNFKNSYIEEEISNIANDINSSKLKENINWGIDINTGLAIPYENKDRPLKDSKFNSIILLIYLTLYYYIKIRRYDTIRKILSKNKAFILIELNVMSEEEISNEIINKNITRIAEYFLLTIKEPDQQLNISFIDILYYKIDTILKIGYSGTFDISLPEHQENDIFDVIEDVDEKQNIEYALSRYIPINVNMQNKEPMSIEYFDMSELSKILINCNIIINLSSTISFISIYDIAIKSKNILYRSKHKPITYTNPNNPIYVFLKYYKNIDSYIDYIRFDITKTDVNTICFIDHMTDKNDLSKVFKYTTNKLRFYHTVTSIFPTFNISDDTLHSNIGTLIIKENLDAIIDICGIFKDYQNIAIASILFNLLNRPIIYITEKDEKKVFIKNNDSVYNEYTEYKNPFLYYSQAHTIGVDIKQDKYPSLKAVCFVDKYTTYKDLAQGMFRLRKLNLGHTVVLYSKDKDITYDIICQNQKNDKNSKRDILLFQLIKATTRQQSNLNTSYKEKVKYLYDIKYSEIYENYKKENYEDKDNLDKNIDFYMLVDEILQIDNIYMYDQLHMIGYKRLVELIFNINRLKSTSISSSTSTSIEIKKQQNATLNDENIYPIMYRKDIILYFKSNLEHYLYFNLDNSNLKIRMDVFDIITVLNNYNIMLIFNIKDDVSLIVCPFHLFDKTDNNIVVLNTEFKCIHGIVDDKIKNYISNSILCKILLNYESNLVISNINSVEVAIALFLIYLENESFSEYQKDLYIKLTNLYRIDSNQRLIDQICIKKSMHNKLDADNDNKYVKDIFISS